jgi:hypothetical protein
MALGSGQTFWLLGLTMAGLSLGVKDGFKPRASTRIAQPTDVFSEPAIAAVLGLLLSEPVLGFELAPMGDCSELEVAGLDAEGLSLEA